MTRWQEWVAGRAERFDREGRLASYVVLASFVAAGAWSAIDAWRAYAVGHQLGVPAAAAAGCLLTAAWFLLLDDPVLRTLAQLQRERAPRSVRRSGETGRERRGPAVRDERMLAAARDWQRSGAAPLLLFVLLAAIGLCALALAARGIGGHEDLPPWAAPALAAGGGLALGAGLLGAVLTRWVRLAARLAAERSGAPSP